MFTFRSDILSVARVLGLGALPGPALWLLLLAGQLVLLSVPGWRDLSRAAGGRRDLVPLRVMAARWWRRGWRGSCGAGGGFWAAARRRRGGRCRLGGRSRRSGCAGCGRPGGRRARA